MLKELARSAPTLFYLHVSEFFDCVGEGLKDPNIAVRECTLEALRCALSLVSHREHNHRHQWYHAIYQDAFEGLMVRFPYLFSFTISRIHLLGMWPHSRLSRSRRLSSTAPCLRWVRARFLGSVSCKSR